MNDRIRQSEEIRLRMPFQAPFFTGKPTFYKDMQDMFKRWEETEKELIKTQPPREPK